MNEWMCEVAVVNKCFMNEFAAGLLIKLVWVRI